MERRKNPGRRHDDARWLSQGQSESLHAGIDAAQAMLRSLAEQVDQSMRSLEDARASLRDVSGGVEQVREAEKHLGHASDVLTKLSSMARIAMSGTAAIGSIAHHPHATPTLGEAIAHAAESATELASQAGVRLHISVSPAAAHQPAGPLYTVAMHAIQNAVEACARRDSTMGDVHVELRPDSPPRSALAQLSTTPGALRPWFVLEVRDSGDGLPAGVAAERLCEPGFTTKPGHAGLGLALARSILAGMGGTLELLPAASVLGEAAAHGCVLRARFPSISTPESSRVTIGERGA